MPLDMQIVMTESSAAGQTFTYFSEIFLSAAQNALRVIYCLLEHSEWCIHKSGKMNEPIH